MNLTRFKWKHPLNDASALVGGISRKLEGGILTSELGSGGGGGGSEENLCGVIFPPVRERNRSERCFKGRAGTVI